MSSFSDCIRIGSVSSNILECRRCGYFVEFQHVYQRTYKFGAGNEFCCCCRWFSLLCRCGSQVRDTSFLFRLNLTAFKRIYNVLVEYIQIDRACQGGFGIHQHFIVISTRCHKVVNYRRICFCRINGCAILKTKTSDTLCNRLIEICSVLQAGNL
ncbi:hypothetical protein D1872_232630 [compost metagenome]